VPYADDEKRRDYQKKWRDSRKEKKREYDAEYRSKYYEKNKIKFKEYNAQPCVREKSLERQKRMAEWWGKFTGLWKMAQGCDRCGVHEGRLIHHHIDPKSKKYMISQMYNHSLENVLDELSKCCVLCEKCHKITHREMKEEG